jgi:hypothetical protein
MATTVCTALFGSLLLVLTLAPAPAPASFAFQREHITTTAVETTSPVASDR